MLTQTPPIMLVSFSEPNEVNAANRLSLSASSLSEPVASADAEVCAPISSLELATIASRSFFMSCQSVLAWLSGPMAPAAVTFWMSPPPLRSAFMERSNTAESRPSAPAATCAPLPPACNSAMRRAIVDEVTTCCSAVNTWPELAPPEARPRTTSFNCACNCGTLVEKLLARPASASTAAWLPITSSARLASGLQVLVTVVIGPETPAESPKRSLRVLMSWSTSALVSLKAANASALPPIASRPWLASRCELSCRRDAEVLAPPKRDALVVAYKVFRPNTSSDTTRIVAQARVLRFWPLPAAESIIVLMLRPRLACFDWCVWPRIRRRLGGIRECGRDGRG